MEKETKSINEKDKELGLKGTLKIMGITFIVILVFSAILVPIFIGIANHEKAIETNSKVVEEITVPNVVGMTFKEAIEELEKNNLEHVIIPWKAPLDDDIVTSQDPPAETKVAKGTEIEIAIKTQITTESNNIYGMRFNKTIEEFCEEYNKALKIAYEQLNEDTTAIELDTLKSTDFSFLNETEGIKQYNCNKIGYSIMIDTETNSEYIVRVHVGYDETRVANSDKMLRFIILKIYPSMIMSLTDFSYTTAFDIIQEYSSKAEQDNLLALFRDNISYNFVTKGTTQRYIITAMTEQFYNEEIMKATNELSNNTDTSTENTISTVDTEQDRTGAESSTNKETTSKSNSRESSSSSSTSTSNNTAMEEDIEATININLKELIAKNTKATEIYQESERMDVWVYVEGAFLTKERFEYFGGSASVPDTITTTATILEYEKKPNEKREVEIIIDNTRAEIKRATLYQGEMVFNKTGTYEIK